MYPNLDFNISFVWLYDKEHFVSSGEDSFESFLDTALVVHISGIYFLRPKTSWKRQAPFAPWTDIPSFDPDHFIMKSGKHKGLQTWAVPESYFEWLIENPRFDSEGHGKRFAVWKQSKTTRSLRGCI